MNTVTNEFTFSFTLTKEEYAKGVLPSLRPAGYLFFGIAFTLALSIQGALDDYYIDSPQWPLKFIIYLASSAAAYIIMLFAIRWLIKVSSYRSYKKYKVHSYPITYIFSDKGAVTNHKVGCQNLAWQAYEKYLFTDELCLLFISNSSRYIIPLRVIHDDDLKAFKQLLSHHIPVTS